ncbi:PLC-like phosphodiesterase [Calocera cornea HHB12733]|uniref:PLC-like phosphodiesterase n=1 Tax=Calocera cornea HHB12733 TaxID=1353952 RepID=A0A165I5A3_9BASI|nr:PLC-like phosphodiesterase [Calocera cornea HHB12733]
MSKQLPECWGHRGASAAFPENTLASFEGAARDGAEGIESDVHVSLDGVILMFHDPSLERTTDGQGLIREQNYHGENGMEHVRTRKEPQQPIPTFQGTVELLMKPENKHLKFNIDVKVYNDPVRLFTLMHDTIASQPGWETELAPRILLGIWHPKFLKPARDLLPYCRRAHIGLSPYLGRKYFWDVCDGFSMNFGALATADGQQFLKDCKAGNKEVMVWTVNKEEEMMECVRWGVNAILTDKTKTWLDMRKELAGISCPVADVSHTC